MRTLKLAALAALWLPATSVLAHDSAVLGPFHAHPSDLFGLAVVGGLATLAWWLAKDDE